jgi:hypothetical protein
MEAMQEEVHAEDQAAGEMAGPMTIDALQVRAEHARHGLRPVALNRHTKMPRDHACLPL